jgi:four helix bundle protein
VQTLPKAAAGAQMRKWLDLFESAMGSASELDHHLLLCKDLKFLHDEDYKRVSRALVEVRKMLGALLESIEGELGVRARAAAKG